jgi:hypothetical protein
MWIAEKGLHPSFDYFLSSNPHPKVPPRAVENNNIPNKTMVKTISLVGKGWFITKWAKV